MADHRPVHAAEDTSAGRAATPEPDRPGSGVGGGTRFSDVLRAENRTTWETAVTHPFVTSLFAGTLPDRDLAAYLVQDYRFADGFMALIGAAVATADNYPSRHRFARFIGEVAGDEDTYFREAVEELSESSAESSAESWAENSAGHSAGSADGDGVPDTEATTGFRQLFADAAASGSYPAVIAVILVCEWLYLDWATRPENRAYGTGPDGYPARPVHAEWVRLHDYPDFHELVAFLRSEMDRVGDRTPEDARIAREFFARTVDLELQFFDGHADRDPGHGGHTRGTGRPPR